MLANEEESIHDSGPFQDLGVRGENFRFHLEAANTIDRYFVKWWGFLIQISSRVNAAHQDGAKRCLSDSK